jgi:hypothetical protein
MAPLHAGERGSPLCAAHVPLRTTPFLVSTSAATVSTGVDLRVLLSTYGSRGHVEALVGLAVRLRALGAEGCDALVATGVMPAGVRI